MSLASGLAQGPRARPELAETAVAAALEKAGLERANGLLLFLSPEFAADPAPALLAAARRASCMSVLGCTAPGLLTEEDWVLDAPAAAALVLGGPLGFRPAAPGESRLSLCAPSTFATDWLDQGGPRFGAVSGDATGSGPYRLWQNGRTVPQGRVEVGLNGCTVRIAVSQGARPLCEPLPIAARGYDVLEVDGEGALPHLARAIPPPLLVNERLPLHSLMAGLAGGGDALSTGRYRLVPIVSADPARQSVTLSIPPEAGERLFWALRDPEAAAADMTVALARLPAEPAPLGALLFPCMGRGPTFYGGLDRDLQLLRERHPGLPIIGFYGNGEIAPVDGRNRLLQYSTVTGLLFPHV